MTDAKNTVLDKKIIDRIKKLLALAANNSSVEEAAAAAAKAQELLEKYAIEEAMLSDSSTQADTIGSQVIWQGGGENSGKVATWLIQLAAGIAEVNRCRLWYRSMFRGKPGSITAAGTTESIAKVKMLLDWLIGEVNRLYNEERPIGYDKSEGKRWGNAFRLGASSTIVTRLRDAMQKARREMQEGMSNNTGLSEQDADTYRRAIEAADIETVMRLDSQRKRWLPAQVQTAIAKLDDEVKRVDAWVKANQKLGSGQKRNTRGTYEDAYRAGCKAGERATLHSPGQ